MTKAISEMTSSQLVTEFNRLAVAAGVKPVKRFADRKSAVKRISALKANGKAPTVKKEDKRSKIGVEFNVRTGTNREKLLEALDANFGKPVTKRDLLKAVYGSTSDDNKGSILMVMKGLYVMIKKYKLPYTIEKGKNEKKEVTFALCSK